MTFVAKIAVGHDGKRAWMASLNHFRPSCVVVHVDGNLASREKPSVLCTVHSTTLYNSFKFFPFLIFSIVNIVENMNSLFSFGLNRQG